MRANDEYRHYGGGIHRYGVMGFLLLLALVTAIVLAYFQVQGPNLVAVEVAVWLLALVVFIMAVCLLYLLFTLRGALRLVRSQATEVAVIRALAHRHEIVEPVTTPAPVEYRQEQPAAATPPNASYSPPLPPSRSVEVIEGIGPVFARRLERNGIETVRDLRAATGPQIAEAAETSVTIADRWKAMADLMVVRSVDPQGAEILVACGIYTVESLAAQESEALLRRCREVNAKGGNRIVPERITKEMCAEWVEGARRYGADASQYAVPRGDAGGTAQTAS